MKDICESPDVLTLTGEFDSVGQESTSSVFFLPDPVKSVTRQRTLEPLGMSHHGDSS